jgi:hypothetical protein
MEVKKFLYSKTCYYKSANLGCREQPVHEDGAGQRRARAEERGSLRPLFESLDPANISQ